MRMCGGFIILSDLCGREEKAHYSNLQRCFLSDLCGREDCRVVHDTHCKFLSDLCGREA